MQPHAVCVLYIRLTMSNFVCVFETPSAHKREDRNEVRCVCICEGALHTSRESSRFQIALIPSLASTVILDVVALRVTPNPINGRDTLRQTKSVKNETEWSR